jgi:hypothetical protein
MNSPQWIYNGELLFPPVPRTYSTILDEIWHWYWGVLFRFKGLKHVYLVPSSRMRVYQCVALWHSLYEGQFSLLECGKEYSSIGISNISLQGHSVERHRKSQKRRLQQFKQGHAYIKRNITRWQNMTSYMHLFVFKNNIKWKMWYLHSAVAVVTILFL